MPISERDFGNLESRVQGIEEDVTEVKADVKQILGKLSGMDGGWRAIAAVGAISAAIGGLIVRLAPHVLP